MKQRIGEKKHRKVEQKIGQSIESCWARGNRHPRYWDIYFKNGDIGTWFPDTEEFTIKKLTDVNS